MGVIRKYGRIVALYAVPITLLSALLSKTAETLAAFDSVAVNKTVALAYVFFQVFWKEILLLLILMLLLPVLSWAGRSAAKSWTTFAASVKAGNPKLIGVAVALCVLVPILSSVVVIQSAYYVRGKAVVLRDIRNLLATAAARAVEEQDLSKARRILDACFVLNRDSIACSQINRVLERNAAIVRRAQDLAVQLPDHRPFKHCLLLQLLDHPAAATEAKREYRALVDRYAASERAFHEAARLLRAGDFGTGAQKLKEAQRFSYSFGYAWQVLKELSALETSKSKTIDPVLTPYAAFLTSSEQNESQMLELDGVAVVVPYPSSDAGFETWKSEAKDAACSTRYIGIPE
jgi:hypothetical protein